MSSIFSTIINFGMLHLLQRLHRLQVYFTIQAETKSSVVFSRLMKMTAYEADEDDKDSDDDSNANDNEQAKKMEAVIQEVCYEETK